MISRRLVLSGALAGSIALVAGCSITPPGQQGNSSGAPVVPDNTHRVVPATPSSDVVIPVTPEGSLAASRALFSAATAVVVVDLSSGSAGTPAATASGASSPTATASPTGTARPSATASPGATASPSATAGPPADGTAGPDATSTPSAAAVDVAVAAEVARALGVPMLVAGDGLLAELERLQTRTVIAYPASGVDVGGRELVAGPVSATNLPDLPGLPATPAASGVLAFASEEPSAPVAATLAAAGVSTTPLAYPNPGVNAESTAAVRASTGGVLGLGEAFGTDARFTGMVASARTAEELPGGGVLPFPGRRMIALYGHPETPALGMMGEQPPAEAVTRLQTLVSEYQALLPDDKVIGAFEIITTVASAGAGDDGDYSYETPIEKILPWIEAAEANDIYVVLDLQPGRTDFVTQAKRYEELLKRPWVGLALDPEWRLKPNEKHLVSIGQVTVDEVNAVAFWLADLVKANDLPPKVLTLHQFQTRMIVERERLDTSRDEVQYLVHVDGQGGQGAKQGTWETIKRGLPSNVFLGWKNFEDEDIPMLTPAQTVAQVKPTPSFISYQ